MADEIQLTTVPAGSVRYRFVSVHRVAGFSKLQTKSTQQTISELQIDLGIEGVSAMLTIDPTAALAQIDRGTAFAHLLLCGLGGHRESEDILSAVEDRAQEIALERLSKHGSPSIYLVLEAQGVAFTTPTTTARDLGRALLAFDAVDKDALKEKHQFIVTTALTAVALTVRKSIDISKVVDGIALTLPDERPLYSLTASMGAVGLTVARVATDEDARDIKEMITAIIQNKNLNSPSRLLADALRSTTDRLESFILSWAALEMVIRKHTAGCESGEWLHRVAVADRDSAAALHQTYIDGCHQNYSLAQKAQMFAFTHEMGAGEDLAAEIVRIRKNFREPLYHEGTVANTLPVESVIALALRAVGAVIKYRPHRCD